MLLQKFWGNYGCAILQPYDMEVGAGTSNPATLLRCIMEDRWNVAYAQPSRRPVDGRYGENPNRLQHYYQFQVILKPSPNDIQTLCLQTLELLGINPTLHDLRFVEDDWENPTLGASGLGWEVWCDGMEVLQFTYMQQIGGIDCTQSVPGELTYGLERLVMLLQNKSSVWDIEWNAKGVKYSDVFLLSEKLYCEYNFNAANTDMLFRHFSDHVNECISLCDKGLLHPAYDQCLKAAHIFNLLDARGVISQTERAAYILRIRELAKTCAYIAKSLHTNKPKN